MKFIVGNIYTQARGTSLEMSDLSSALTVDEPGADFDAWAPKTRCFLEPDGTFYSGLWRLARTKLRDKGHDVEVEYLSGVRSEERRIQPDPAVVPGKILRDYQISGIQKAVFHEKGIVKLSTGAGKTTLTIGIIRTLDLPSLFVVHSSNLLVQTAWKFVDAGLGDELVVIGSLKDDTKSLLEKRGVIFWDPQDPEECLSRRMCVAMVHSLYSLISRQDDTVEELLDKTQILIADEVHHLASRIWGVVFSQCQARYRFGLSATPWVEMEFSDNSRDYQVMGLVGPVLYELPNVILEDQGAIEKPSVYMSHVKSENTFFSTVWPDIYRKGIVECKERNEQVISYAKMLHAQGEKTIIPVGRKDHLYWMVSELQRQGIDAYGSMGGRSVLEWNGRAVVESSMTPEDLHCLVASVQGGFTIVCTSVYDEALDLPELTAIIMAAGGKSVRQTLQRIGRVLRPSGAGEVLVIDFFDHVNRALLSHSYQRRKIYKEMGWNVEARTPHLQAFKKLFS